MTRLKLTFKGRMMCNMHMVHTYLHVSHINDSISLVSISNISTAGMTVTQTGGAKTNCPNI